MLPPTTTTTRTKNPDAKGENANSRIGGMPLGFEAGDANLYRYVNNGPTHSTDPSGLQQIRDPWDGEEIRRALDISGLRYAGWVNAAIASLDTTYVLNRIGCDRHSALNLGGLGIITSYANAENPRFFSITGALHINSKSPQSGKVR